MNSQSTSPSLGRPAGTSRLTVALLGNPNTGKTTLFNALSGLRQHVGNYPGVTVETKKGTMHFQGTSFSLIDLPGTYSLAARSPDEMVAVDVILGQQAGEVRPDVVVCIVDASNLDRNLYLTSQALEMGVPVVVALNMMDVAQSHGLRIDFGALSRQLGARVVPIQANRHLGLDDLRQAILEVGTHPASASPTSATEPGKIASGRDGITTEVSPKPARSSDERITANNPPTTAVTQAPGNDKPISKLPDFPEAFEHEVVELHRVLSDLRREANNKGQAREIPPFLIRRLLLDVGGYTEERLMRQLGGEIKEQVQQARARLAEAGCPVPAVEARARYTWIRQITGNSVQRPAVRPVTWTDRLDRVLTHRVWGTAIFLVVMLVVFQSIFTWAGPLMDLVDAGKESLADAVAGALPRGPLTSLLVDGIIEGVGGVLIFLPQILILFAFIAILEDCGYMARAAFLMDRLMARCGLSGKSFIPMLSSVACAIPGIMAARVIENRRDRLATILVAPLMSCSARLPVYVLLIGAFLTVGYAFWVPGFVLFCMYAIGLVVAPLVAWALKSTVLRGPRPVFVMEMPAYKWPSWRTVVRRVFDSGWAFVRRAGTLILASMVLVWALLYFPAGTYPEQIAQLEEQQEAVEDENRKEEIQRQINRLNGEWKRNSLLGQAGQAIEPAVRPLGWDWRIGVATLASFPAREVVVGTLGILYNQGEVDAGEVTEGNVAETGLGKALRASRWNDTGLPVFNAPVALGIMVFFALCCQCASTLAVIKRETGSWSWPAFTFVYMTVLAYVGALVVYQVGRWFV